MQVNMLEAKTRLSKLGEAALRGEDVVIANRGKPVVRLVRAESPNRWSPGAMNALLLDTHVLLWWLLKPQKLSRKVHALIENPYDRMLVGTARAERMVFVTRDAGILDSAAPVLGELLLEA